jgi:hypothetical protein
VDFPTFIPISENELMQKGHLATTEVLVMVIEGPACLKIQPRHFSELEKILQSDIFF